MVATIRVSETTIGHAVQDYLEDRGYVLKSLTLTIDERNKEVYIIAETEGRD
jgi:hypothetical protein